MGGLSGHMMHPYDNYGMTKKELLTLIGTATSRPMVEKIDGFGFHAIIKDGKVRIARSKGDLQAGGTPMEDLAERFSHNPTAVELYGKALTILQRNIEHLMKYEDDHLTLNCEIIIKGTANTIPYDHDMVFIHNIWKWTDDWKSHVILRGADVNTDKLTQDCTICRPVIFNHPFYGSMAENEMIMYIDHLFGKCRTIRELYQHIYIEDIVSRYPGHTYVAYKMLYNRIMNDEKISLKKLRNAWNTEDLDEILADATNIKRSIQAPLRDLIEEFGCYILRHCSGYLNDGNDAVKIIRDSIEFTIPLSEEINYQLNRLEKLNNEIFGLEGVVIEFNDNLYKFTGSFGIINKLMHGGK